MSRDPLGHIDREAPHRRQNLLTGEWVLVSPHRMKRPWQGKVEKRATDERPAHDPTCYLCPRNERVGGESNPDYAGPWAFDNDFAALQETVDRRPSTVDRGPSVAAAEPGSGNRNPESNGPELLVAREETGTSRVVCFSPRHDLTLPELDVPAIRAVVDLWAHEYATLGQRDDIGWVQIFENKGELMGCSNPHPHGQIWAQSSVPGEPAKEGERMRAHFDETGRSLLADYLALELELDERIIITNDAFVALVPFWAVWPFETLVIAREHRRSLVDFSDAERDGLADILKRLTTRYDNLFEMSFPYSAGMHQAPTDSGSGIPDPGFRIPETGNRKPETGNRKPETGNRKPETGNRHWHWHMHFYPPLLRSATVKKFMVGYEMLGEAQRDLTAEAAAERLRGVGDVHYRAAGG